MTSSRTHAPAAGQSFGRGVLVLSAAAIVTKIIGLVFRIPLLAAIGMEGMAYFLAANHFYIWFYTLATAGLPVAISILIAQARASLPEAQARERITAVWTCALRAFLVLGALGTGLMIVFAPAFAELTGIRGAVRSIWASAPTLFFICLAAAVRGYFQGHGLMTPTAVSELLESGSKLFLGLGFAALALKLRLDTPTVAAFAIAGITVGSLLSMLYLFGRHRRFMHAAERQGSDPSVPAGALAPTENGEAGRRSTFRALLTIAAPVTLSSSVIALAGLVDTLLISSRLQAAGIPEQVANAWYSCFGNLALPLYGLAPALIGPVALALIPSLTAAVKARQCSAARNADKHLKTEQTVLSASLRLASLISIPAALGLAVFGEPILRLLFPGEELVPLGARLLSILAISIPLAAHMTVSNAVLQAYGHPAGPIWSMAAGTAVKIAVEYLLVGNPAVGIYGAPISTFFCNVTIMALNYYQIKRYAPGLQGMGILYARPLCAAAPAVGGAMLAYVWVWRVFGHGTPATLAALGSAALLYAVLSYRFKAWTMQDLALFYKRKQAVREAGSADEAVAAEIAQN